MKTKKKQKVNWELTIERLIILFLLFAVLGLLIYINPDNGIEKKQLDKSICQRIQGTPAWINNEGKILAYGLVSINKSDKEFSDKFTSDLINNQITFVYHEDCGYCKLQIAVFGDENFNKLKEKGLTLNCKE